MAEEHGQASVELVAALPALLLAALVALQLLAAGYAMTLADGAAEAGALALASGGSAADAAREALPGWARDDVSVAVQGDRVSVRLRPPSPFEAVADRLAVESSAGGAVGAMRISAEAREVEAATARRKATPAACPEPDPVWTRPTEEMVPPPAPLRFEAPPSDPTVVVTAIGAAEGSRATAAALACAGAEAERAPLLVDLDGRAPRPTLVTSASARALEERLAAHLPSARVAARGHVCHLAAAADPEGFGTAGAAATVARGGLAVVHAPPARLQELLDDPTAPRFTGALLRADVGEDRALLSLVVGDLLDRGLAVGVLKRRLGWVVERRALFGALGIAEGLSPTLRRRLIQYPYGGVYGAGS